MVGIASALASYCVLALGARQIPKGGGRSAAVSSFLVSQSPSSSRETSAAIEEAKENLRAGSADRAVALLRRITQREPNNPDAHLLLGTALAMVPERSEALKELRLAVKLAPKSAAAHSTLGTALAGFAEFAEARTELETAVGLDPAFIQAHIELGLVLAQQNENVLARKHLEKAIQLMGNSPQAAYPHYLLARLWTEQKELEKAQQELKAAIALRPDYAEAYLSLGLAREEAQDQPGAIEALRRAAALAPNDFSAQHELGAAFLRAGKPAQAIGPLRRATGLNPADRPALSLLCRAFEGAKRTEEARACAQRELALMQRHLSESGQMLAASEANRRGIELEKEGNFAGALEEFRAAVRLDPSQTVLRRNLALTLCRLGRWQEGVRELRRVLAEDPQDAEATRALYIALDNLKSPKNGEQSAASPHNRP